MVRIIFAGLAMAVGAILSAGCASDAARGPQSIHSDKAWNDPGLNPGQGPFGPVLGDR